MLLPASPRDLDSAAGDPEPAESPSANGSIRLHEPPAAFLSPSIQRTPGEKIAAFEMKFLIDGALARQVQHWASQQMRPDAFADPRQGGTYQTTTLYLDTPRHDVFHRGEGHRTRKYRLRRYGSESRVYLERKTRRQDRVSKRRCDVGLHELATFSDNHTGAAWTGDWFRHRVNSRDLRPVCRITYERSAFVQMSAEGPLRMTLDRQIRGLPTSSWDLTPLGAGQGFDAGQGILPDHVICEFKFRGGMPQLFKEVIRTLQLEVGGVSKYRRMMLATGAVAANAGGVDADGANSDEGRGHA